MPHSVKPALSMRTRCLALLLCLPAVLCLSLSSAAQTAGQLTEDQIKHDAGVKEQVGKTGEYRIEVGAVPYRLYLETLDHFKALKDRDQARQAGKKYTWLTPNEGGPDYSYQVWAPASYDPDLPAGLIVFINSGDSGTLSKKYREELAARNLIVIGANHSGNKVDTAYRLTFAFYAVELMNRRYNLDPQRVYITGNSGGGRAASHAMFYRPGLFKGGLPMVGCMAPIENGNKAFQLGTPPMHAMPSKNAIREAAKNGRYVFLTGEKDYNRKECEATAKYLQGLGFKHATVMVEPGLGHSSASPAYFAKALDFVDAPLIASASKTLRDAEADLQRGRLEAALEGFRSALPHLSLSSDEQGQASAEQAQTHIDDLDQQYAGMVKAVEDAIAAKDDRGATEALRELQRSWRGRLGREAANDYRKQILEIKRAG